MKLERICTGFSSQKARNSICPQFVCCRLFFYDVFTYICTQGVPSTIDDHLFIVGDAAGHIDPLTGVCVCVCVCVCARMRAHVRARASVCLHARVLICAHVCSHMSCVHVHVRVMHKGVLDPR